MKTFRILTALSLSVLLFSCGLNTNTINDLNKVSIKTESKNFSTVVKGQVQWPASFNTKATIDDIAPYGTVSIIYPYDHATKANQVVATGLTNSSGIFSINPELSFQPTINEIFVIEVSKRLGGSGYSLIGLRSYLKWNGNGWDSMTSPGIYINTNTTALAIISELQNIPPELTIGTINHSTGSSVPGNVIEITTLQVTWSGSDGSTTQVYVGNADGSGTPVKVSTTTSSNGLPSFCSDGTKVAWDTSGQIYVGNADGSGTPVKVSTGSSTNNSGPQISPDGSQVVWWGSDGSTNQIYIGNADGSGTPVKVSTSTSSNSGPQFSSDGTKVVWYGIDGSSTEQIYVGNADGSGTPVKVSTGSSTINKYPYFSSDDSKVVYQGFDSTWNQIYVGNADGSITPVKVSTSSNDNSNGRFSHDGTKVTWRGYGSTTYRIFVGNADASGTPVIISTSSNDNYYPQFSPDDTKVTWMGDNGSSIRQVYTGNTDSSGTPVQLSSAPSNFTMIYPLFSPDSTKVTWNNYDGSTNQVYVGNADGTGTPVKISTSTTSNVSPQFGGGLTNVFVQASKVTEVANIVTTVLTNNKDPLTDITYSAPNYSCSNCP